MALRRAHARSSRDPSELLSIVDRAKHLEVLRLGLGTVVVAATAVWPAMATVPVSRLVIATVAYLGVSAAILSVLGRSRRIAIPALHGGLLLDGIYLAAMVALTGGAASPLCFLLSVQVVGVTLLCSYRTGLKIALWDTLLFLLGVQAIEADLLPAATTSTAMAPALTIAGLWFLALGAAWFSAAAERDLRHQKADLADLSEMVALIDAAGSGEAGGIPRILLDRLCATFQFVRGVVLASPEGDLELLAASEAIAPVAVSGGLDPLMSRAWSERSAQLVRRIDPTSDPRLASLLPSARNVMVVPLFLVGGHRLGIVALERRDGGAMRRWEVAMIEQFAAHAALALYNSWLTAEREAQLETISRLEQRQRAHNAELEDTVAERTAELRAVINDLQEANEQRRKLLHHVVRAAEDERRRIAHDVHDDPVQKLAAVKMRLEMLATKHPELPDIAESHKVVASTMGSMRRMLFDLSPPILDEEGIGPALEYFLEHSPVTYRWSVQDDLEVRPSTQTRLILYRTAQEALTNARKHADATIVRVTLQDRDGGVWMEIEDDGVGFEPQRAVVAAPGHLGLAAIRERAEMAGGWCSLQSLPGAGTCLQVWLPSDAEAAGVPDPTEGQDGLATVHPIQDRIAF
jgi:signal transduction histidine kinase